MNDAASQLVARLSTLASDSFRSIRIKFSQPQSMTNSEFGKSPLAPRQRSIRLVHLVAASLFTAQSAHAADVPSKNTNAYEAYEFQPVSNWIAVSKDQSKTFCFDGLKNQKSFIWDANRSTSSIVADCAQYDDQHGWSNITELPQSETSTRPAATIFGDGSITYVSNTAPCLINFMTTIKVSPSDGSDPSEFYIVRSLAKKVTYAQASASDQGCAAARVTQDFDAVGTILVVPVNDKRAYLIPTPGIASPGNSHAGVILSFSSIPTRVVQVGIKTPDTWLVPAKIAGLFDSDTPEVRYKKMQSALKRSDRLIIPLLTLPQREP